MGRKGVGTEEGEDADDLDEDEFDDGNEPDYEAAAEAVEEYLRDQITAETSDEELGKIVEDARSLSSVEFGIEPSDGALEEMAEVMRSDLQSTHARKT